MYNRGRYEARERGRTDVATRDHDLGGGRRVSPGSSLKIEVREDLGCDREPLLREAP